MSQQKSNDYRQTYVEAAKEFADNPGQLKAYESAGNCVILAGPGSGKTKTLTTKLGRMISEDVRPPRGVACLTFSLECAAELERRLRRLGVEEGRHTFIGTVHSFCFQQIILPFANLCETGLPRNPRVAVDSEKSKIFAEALARVISADEPPSRWRTKAECYRRSYLDKESAEFKETDPDLAQLVIQYEAALHGAGLIDFDDMALTAVAMIEQNEWLRRTLRARFPILAVDEYQDLEVPLHRIVLQLCFVAKVRLLAVGDPDQSIYGFAGAQPELLRQLANRKDVETVQLPFNYRAGQALVDISQTVLQEDRSYKSKVAHEGTIYFYEVVKGLHHQAEMICKEIIPEILRRNGDLKLGDIAVLYVDKNDGAVIAEVAAACSFPFIRIDKGSAYRKTPITRWLEDAVAWCSGGWRVGLPRLSQLIRRWQWFHRTRLRSDSDRRLYRKELTRFLFSRRDPTLSLSTYVDDLFKTSLADVLREDLSLTDERLALEELKTACGDGAELNEMTLAGFSGTLGSATHLNLITLHSAKSLEFAAVIMMGLEQGRIPSYGVNTVEAKREPRRLFYVGLTRAKKEVHMTYSGWTENRYGRRFNNGPSEFLLEIQEKLKQASGDSSHV